MMSEKTEIYQNLPLLPMRDLVIFPNMMIPFFVGRDKSIKALDYALEKDQKIFLATQKDALVNEPEKEDIYLIGVVSKIIQSLKMPNGNIKVLIEGLHRAKIIDFIDQNDYLEVVTEKLTPRPELSDVPSHLTRDVTEKLEQYLRLSQNINSDVFVSTLKETNPDKLADSIAAHLNIEIKQKQELLETVNPKLRMTKLQTILDIEIEKVMLDEKINEEVKKQMEKAQREYYLNEKIKAIHKELGRTKEKVDEIDQLREKIDESGMPDKVKEKAEQELEKLESMPPMSAEATVSRGYLDWLISMPWNKRSREKRDLIKAEKILNDDHYALEKPKERILEFLAVRQLVKKQKGSILCFVGAPGVGKTSLASSIARATGRKFVRLSLGGVRDEAEIRGHRRTYIGAFPGRIIQMIKRAETKNPVFLLDEVDKMSTDFRGDPSSALLEVLDPEQNHSFLDHYLDVEFDLSEVMFIATANVLHPIPRALQDRMEVIHLSGYTLAEKIEIAERHLISKQLKEHGLHKKKIVFTREAIKYIIEKYTREAGVRNLERSIASLLRKMARQYVTKSIKKTVKLTPEKIEEYLGIPKYRKAEKEQKAEVGLVMGVAWTEMGGELLATECTLMPGKSNLKLTGQLGDVMQESAQAAMSYVRSNSLQFGIPYDIFKKNDVHIHVPEGAIPKDGPSAGITMATALVSAFTRVPVRHDIAMTGEITLRGKVLPIGGLKEKVLAAHRAGIMEIIIPAENEKNIEDIPPEILKEIKLHKVENVNEVIKLALTEELKPIQDVKKLDHDDNNVTDGIAH
ncbi:MAG: endopeptidase La [Acidobacteria bacterium]|nr:endopeptidase La [Acidobacteriota bacterium]